MDIWFVWLTCLLEDERKQNDSAVTTILVLIYSVFEIVEGCLHETPEQLYGSRWLQTLGKAHRLLNIYFLTPGGCIEYKTSNLML